MNRRDFLKSSFLAASGLALAPVLKATRLPIEELPFNAQGQRVATGYVFHDRNGNGRREQGDPGVSGVCVSNGTDVVKTDRQGKWELAVTEDTVLFVIKPSGWAVPLNDQNLPQHYYIHKPAGSPDYDYKGVRPTGSLPSSIDFALTPQREDRKFNMVMCGDPQPRNQQEIDYMAHDIIEQMIPDAAAHDCKFGISLGDIMFDRLEHYDSYNRTMAAIGIPWHNVLGNHDLNFDSPDDAHSTETFQSHYGSPYYAFNYGQVHFIILDNVFWRGNGENRGYHGEITKQQLDFVKNDLAQVPKHQLVVICMHIPIIGTNNRQDFYRLIEDRPNTLSFSAHTHIAQHHFLGEEAGWRGQEPHHHVNHVTLCGSWWSGAPDERGIPHATMSDGGPNGYSIVEFNGSDYKITFRPASRPMDEQFNIWLPEEIDHTEVATKTMIVNVFAGSPRSKTEMKVGNGDWVEMENINAQDPFYLRLKEIEGTDQKPPGRNLPNPQATNHVWKATLPTNIGRGTHNIQVRTTDMFGQTYQSSRFVRVV